jgi:hypothetical protein
MHTQWFGIGMVGVFLVTGLRAPLPQTRDANKSPGRKVLIVMDERPQMEVLAKYFSEKAKIESVIVDQKSMPEDWSGFLAVVGYIHGRLEEKTELKIIDTTKAGGRFVCLHHMISSGKSRNKNYFDFLGVHMDGIDLARQPAEPGGHYAWREGIRQTIVNVNPKHYITSNGVQWPEKTAFAPPGTQSRRKEYPALTIEDSEVYMNVKFSDGKDKTILLGYKYMDDRNKVLHQQLTSGWIKPSGKGWIVYLQMGHSSHEYEIPAVAQMALNAVTWKPGARN